MLIEQHAVCKGRPEACGHSWWKFELRVTSQLEESLWKEPEQLRLKAELDGLKKTGAGQAKL